MRYPCGPGLGPCTISRRGLLRLATWPIAGYSKVDTMGVWYKSVNLRLRVPEFRPGAVYDFPSEITEAGYLTDSGLFSSRHDGFLVQSRQLKASGARNQAWSRVRFPVGDHRSSLQRESPPRVRRIPRGFAKTQRFVSA